MQAFFMDMTNETARNIPAYTGSNSKIVALANGQVLLATPFEIADPGYPRQEEFGRFVDVFGGVISQDILIDEHGRIAFPQKTAARNSR